MTDLAPLPPGPVRRVAFLGTPDMAVPVMSRLVESGVEVVHVVTRADKRRGRGGELMASPVKIRAVELGIPVSHRVDALLDLEPFDLGVVVAYGALVRPHVLARIPMVNLHFSLLPRWRGAAPVERALLAGDAETGVCLMRVEEGLDTGGVFDRRRYPISDSTTADDIRRALVDEGAEMLVHHLRHGLPIPVAQSGEATYAAKIEPSELRLNWSSAESVSRLVRLGGAYTVFRGRRLKVHGVRVGGPDADGARVSGRLVVAKSSVWVGTPTGPVELTEVQPEGRPRMDAAAWVNGNRPVDGEALDGG